MKSSGSSIDESGITRLSGVRIIATGILLISSFVLAFLIGEVAVRTMYPQQLGMWTYTREGLTLHLPNHTGKSLRFGHEIRTNSFGMRDREHALKKEASTFRILVLGDSFMEALQVKFEESFPNLLEKRLQKAVGRVVEVINASVSGWGTDDELTYLIREGGRFDPDLILVAMTLHNDVNDNLVEEYHKFEEGEIVERPITSLPRFSYALLKVKEWLATNSQMYQVLIRAIRFRRDAKEGETLNFHVIDLLRRSPSKRLEQGWNMTQQLFKKLLTTGHAMNARVAVVLLPLRVQVYPDAFHDLVTEASIQEAELDIEAPQRMMETFGSEVGLSIIDLLPNFQYARDKCNCQLFIEDDGHWNEQGHLVATEGVVREILRSGWISSH